MSALAGESISFPNRAAAEIDIYGGIRPTVGMFAFDFGVWGYLYPGGACFNAAAIPGSGIPGFGCELRRQSFGNSDPITGGLPINGNFAKKNASFYEGYAKVNVTLNDQFQIGVNNYYYAEHHEPRRLGRLRIDHRQVDRTEHDLRLQRRRHVHLRRVRSSVARNV